MEKSQEVNLLDLFHLLTIRNNYFLLVTGFGDVTYNARRNILGAISVTGKIGYHLFNIATSKTDETVKLIRKSKWHPQFSTVRGNW